MNAFKLFALSSALSLAGAHGVSAAPQTWSGGGATNNWNDSGNWGGTAVATGDSLIFDGVTRLAPNNNLATASFQFTGITFNATAGAFVVTGNGTKVAGNIVDNNGSLVETLNFSSGSSQLVGSNRSISVTTGGSLVLQSNWQGAVGFSKTGGGTLTLAGNNSGMTTAAAIGITAGKVLANGISSTGQGTVNISNNATLGGSGAMNPTGASTVNFAAGGILAPGTTGNTDALTISALSNTNTTGFITLAGAKLNFNLGAANTASELNLQGVAADGLTGLSGNIFNFTDLTAGSLVAGKYTLIASDSAVNNPFQGLSTGSLSGFTLNGLGSYTGYSFGLELNQLVGSGNYALQLNVAAVPEPRENALLIIGLMGLALVMGARSRRKQNA